MLRIAGRSSAAAAAKRAVSQTPRRFAHGVHYGSEEPLSRYVPWVGVVGAFTALLAYDRFYSEGAISQMVTPETAADEIEIQRREVMDKLAKEQERNIEFLFPRQRSVLTTNFNAHPVPVGSYRESHSNNVIDPATLSERRPRSTV